MLDGAVTMLAPAEVCTAYEHPNLRTWRYLREEIGEGGTAVARGRLIRALIPEKP
jgi:hypothetical protein